MTPIRHFALALLLAALPLRAELFTPETAVAPAALAARWDGVLGELARADWVRAPFREKRRFAIRKAPTILAGDLVLSRTHGLSLHYSSTAVTGWDLVIVDEQGLLLRDARGKELVPPGDPRAAGGQRALLDILRLDLDRLAAEFDLFAEGERAAWRLGLRARTTEARRAAVRVIIEGNAAAITRIVLDKPGAQEVEIEIGTPTVGAAADPDELRARFRRPAARP